MPSASNIILTSDSRQKGGDDDAADTSAQRMNVGKINASTLDYEEKRSTQKSLKDVDVRRSALLSSKSRDRTKGSQRKLREDIADIVNYSPHHGAVTAQGPLAKNRGLDGKDLDPPSGGQLFATRGAVKLLNGDAGSLVKHTHDQLVAQLSQLHDEEQVRTSLLTQEEEVAAQVAEALRKKNQKLTYDQQKTK